MTVGKGMAPFLAMADFKHTAQPKNLISQILVEKGGAPHCAMPYH